MDWADLAMFGGGLGLFLYGMHLMGEGLSAAAGPKLEALLGRLTDSPLKAVGAGAAVTAVIQSSSATTVMVVELIEAGIMKLEQAVGVILGANIGTTVTAWLLCVSGEQGSAGRTPMIDPIVWFTVPALVGGAVLLWARQKKAVGMASVLVGMELLFFGMEIMSDAAASVMEVPGFTEWLVRFEHPVLGILGGMLFTAVIQSSSASIGMLQALSAGGLMRYGTVIPVIMGQNIGTCVTALWACIGVGKTAGYAARIHLYFNVLGAAVFMIIFYGLNAVCQSDFPAQPANCVGIAMIHSMFNISATIILLPVFHRLARCRQ